MWNWTSGKNKTFYSKALIENPLFSLFNWNLIHGAVRYGDKIKVKNSRTKIEKLQEKAIRIINFLPVNATVEKQMHEMNIIKLKDFIMLHLISICKQVKDCLNQNALVDLMINFTPQEREHRQKTFVMLSRFWLLRGTVQIPLFKGGEGNFDYLHQRGKIWKIKKKGVEVWCRGMSS